MTDCLYHNRNGADGFAMVAARHAMTSSEVGSENYGALPSSYRRVRKSKSLVALPSGNLRLRLQRSLPFLRRQSTTAFYNGADGAWGRHEEAVQMARAQFLDGSGCQTRQETEQQTPRKVERKAQHKFRKTVRASGFLETGQPAETAVPRSFSLGLRDRVRKVLGKSLSKKDSLPPQQLEAQRNHFSEFDKESTLVSGFDAYQITDDGLTPRLSGCSQPIREHDPLEDLDKVPYTVHSAASRESLHSNARSRVTSWTNSSITGSIGLRSGPIERNRLSIIKEDGGPHQPSSSAGKHIGGVEVFHEPLQSVTNDGRTLPAVDSRRIYSALIKRINQEEAEVERTRIALEVINQGREEMNNKVSDSKATIRAVQSDSSLSAMTLNNPNRRTSSHSGSWHHSMGRGRTDEQSRENAGKRRERLVEQESQSTFFPFSSEKNPNTPSPFKRFLNERRRRSRSGSSRGGQAGLDSNSVIVNRRSSSSVMNRPQFGLSSASIYSRTTNGGSNEQYHRPYDSSEELRIAGPTESEQTGTATILATAFTSSMNGRWNPWSETLNRREQAPDSNSSSHTRERAQINSEEEDKDDEEVASGPLARSADRHIPVRRYLGTFSDVPGASTPKARSGTASGRPHTDLLKRVSADALSSISNQAEDGSKGSGSLRKLSPGNLTKLFKEKRSQRPVGPQSAGKENSPTIQADSPPVSTPGRLHLQFRNGTTNGRLRKKGSDGGFQSRNLYSTPRGSISTTPSRSHESPSENAKDLLKARLSRPFNMDVPPHNRPFDSMYLGKRTPGHPDTFGSSRLSVAPRTMLDGGGLDMPTDLDEVAEGETALPSRSYSVGKSAAKVLGLLGSKRMVSSFLRSRRGERSTSAGEHSLVEGSPAFI
ncbi:uncharacterized protein Z519_02288 [Cladophialophora bantiana CBS 173.52]|uniref:Uncharacterized protein n=1 Tax=Cladophialophora bantiana (strain ATCC 10958 / CBS 173.52 / CDC B-1940 / NIH 8579) TaxID=1442370 RepID=A0A0D2GEW4_CLAB1|nr:uncharacterized protein Z519_02288 [Cladophialophora bantiana CBS 173.52]KIW96897.1 hypothetical protein Z519_02288 [Cladophialophora bantiana CBS 173.52]